MTWLIVTGILFVLLAAAIGAKRYVCFRRKDCCGNGCGCLFPVRRSNRDR